MAEPEDMVVPMLKEIRTEVKSGFNDVDKRFTGVEKRLDAIERRQKSFNDALTQTQ